uniref:Uncharacterized protein n=1 Tax=Timema douglasi TaxID=61478 RepID=A0A7R8VEJ4_TIMDO|nr:unnamed protein product [Timema douglasi]
MKLKKPLTGVEFGDIPPCLLSSACSRSHYTSAMLLTNCIAQEISCNEFGFFCADRIRFGNCIDYTNGTMSADVSFLIECPENTYCNIESVSICKEVTENTLQLTTSLKTENRSDLSLDLVHVLSKLNSILNGSNESKYSNDFSHSNTLDDSGDSEELDEDSDEDETEDSGNDSEDDNKSNDSSEFDESNNSD